MLADFFGDLSDNTLQECFLAFPVPSEEANFSGDGRTRRLPPEAAGNHQMKNEEQLALGLEHDAFPQPTQADNLAAFDRRQRRGDRPQQEGIGEPHAGHTFTEDARLQCTQVEEDVRQFGHGFEKENRSIFRDWLEN